MKKATEDDTNKDVESIVSEAERKQIEEKRKKTIEEALTKGKLERAK